LIKMFVVGRFIEKYTGSEVFLASPSFRNLAILLLAFPLYIYINFSGYCDIMIGFARAVGFELPENFRHPYLARNSIDFWRRWHITLSEFFRDYLYFPLYTAMARKGIWPWMATGAAVLFSFAAMGAWHGSRLGFVIFGLLHGIGVIAALAYEALLRAALAKDKLEWYRNNPVINVLSVVCFQAFVVLSFLPFQFNGDQLRSILRAVRTLLGTPV
jgi:D-alanyl-lipoteichoic acid acyltransferase DltB (MBOAT superfamily)